MIYGIEFQELLQNKDEQIEALQMKFETLQIELQELQAQSMLESNVEREEEMERLRIELLEATKMARQLFSVTTNSHQIDDTVTQMQSKITSLNKTINTLHYEIKQYEMENNELMRNLEIKDVENQKVNAELRRLREETFGSAEVEINRLEKQLNFRERQIEKLTAKCSLLQAELSSAFDVSNQKLANDISATNSVQKSSLPEKDEAFNEDGVDSLQEVKEDIVESKKKIMKIQKRPIQSGKRKVKHEIGLESLEASAMIISSLNHELMRLMQELDEKDCQLERMEKSVQQAASSIDELKVNYFNLQKEVSENDMTQHNKDIIDKLRQQTENYEIEIEEYQQKLEEMNRQIIAERLRNLQLVRKIEIVESNRNNQNIEYRKLEKAIKNNDLASIEIARLQTLLLHSVPKRDYDKLLAQHKQILASDNNYKLTNYLKNNEKDNEYIGINLLEMTDEIKSAEITAENAHLKEMINVLRSQNEYWQLEVEKIREQNTEMVHFLEDVESESQMKSLLVALERRFLKALSDRAQFSQNQKLTNYQFIDQQNEIARKNEIGLQPSQKITFLSALRLLTKRMRSNSMELLTVQDMLEYKEKMIEIDDNYAKSQKYKDERKEELDLQLRHAEALRKSYELLQENDYSMIKLQKSLQASHFNMLNGKKQLENAEIQIQRKDEQIQKLEETVKSLQREIEDLFAATFKISDFIEENEKIDESIYPITAELLSNVEKETLLQSVENDDLKPNVQNVSDEKANLEIEESEIIDKGETPTETIDSESDVKYHTTTSELHTTDGTHKITNMHSEEYMKKLNYICETAKLCIANYKEQLKYKDEVIEKYKSFLKIMPDEQANRRLTKDLQHFHSQMKDYAEANTQTDSLQKDDKIIEGICDSNNLPNVIEESRKSVISQESSSTITRTSSLVQSSHIVQVEATNIQNNDDTMMETLRREESKMMIMRMEIRDLKQRNAALHIKNQELEKICESIRAEALSEIKHSYSSNINVESEAIVMRLQQELNDLKIEAGNQKKLIREQKRSSIEEVLKWHEKKAREESSRSAELKRLQEMIRRLRSDKEMSDLQVKIANDHLKTAEETNTYLNQKIVQLKKENDEILSNVNEKEEISKDKKITDDIAETHKYNISDEELRELRKKAEQYDNLMKQLIKLETETGEYREEIRLLNDKLNERKYDCGAVAVLRDKLMAKEKIIEQQQQRIEELEREKWQNLL
ncbi:hypothetical protein DINM_003748 [Dirofilaria immitis]|nr:hypothetical protein [Dirofilaria immitis]